MRGQYSVGAERVELLLFGGYEGSLKRAVEIAKRDGEENLASRYEYRDVKASGLAGPLLMVNSQLGAN